MLRRAGAVTMLGLAAAMLAGCSTPPPPAPDELARQMFDISNEQRVDEGLEPLEWNDCLADKAAERAEPFVEDPELVHAPLVATCHEGVTAGENLARTDLTAGEVVDLWMGSPGHRANILNGEFVIGAVACFEAEDGIRACAQLFEG